ncbi:hypothetical protein [Shewanella acanthi]|uniref:hypothetical protein n=1 Tax=Shewanella acanthi TaxID=2864212 RepID=UPI001C6620BF|nr:hypothetical protein [Shewanella acanthi]QYJ80709.1 hypothetical protein K0H61_06160 [Shewanella acanthi]
MMWNWFTNLLGINERPKRKKVLIDIPFEQHRTHGNKYVPPANRSSLIAKDSVELESVQERLSNK